MAAIAYYFLSHFIIKMLGKESILANAIGKDRKGIFSIVLYIAGFLFSSLHPIVGFLIYGFVAGIWFIPDKRIEKHL